MLFRAGLVVALSSLAVLLGGISAAWRRACVHITRHRKLPRQGHRSKVDFQAAMGLGK